MAAATAEDLNNQIIKLAASCRYDPVKWSKAAWDWGHGQLEDYEGPRDWQNDINEVIRDHLANPETRHQPLRISVASGHGIGKSAEMGMLSNWAMSCWDDARIVTTANTEGQLRTKTAPEIGKWFRSSLTSNWFDVQAMSIKSRDPEHSETWRQDFIPWSEHNTEAFAGLHNKGKIILLLFDEASKIHDKVWEVAEGALTDEDTVIIWVVFGNPTRNTGRFRECFRRFRHRWVNRQIDSRTVPGTNKAYLQQLVDDNGEDSDIVKIRVRGMFPSMSAKQFISEADVDAAFGKHLRDEQYKFAPVILGVDPAWSGDDELVIVKRQGLYSEVLLTMAKNDNDVHVANIICRLQDEHKAVAVFVDGGYGTGIISAGATMGRSWQIVWFGGGAIDKGCKNKRAEMWRDMRDWLKAGGSIPKDNVLRDDLTGIETLPNLQGIIQLEPKEALKERGMPSPNRADALALTFAFPVMSQVQTAPQASAVRKAYDPFSV
jgi:hypothetical protein